MFWLKMRWAQCHILHERYLCRHFETNENSEPEVNVIYSKLGTHKAMASFLLLKDFSAIYLHHAEALIRILVYVSQKAR